MKTLVRKMEIRSGRIRKENNQRKQSKQGLKRLVLVLNDIVFIGSENFVGLENQLVTKVNASNLFNSEVMTKIYFYTRGSIIRKSWWSRRNFRIISAVRWWSPAKIFSSSTRLFSKSYTLKFYLFNHSIKVIT